jgi:hypothetical protein
MKLSHVHWSQSFCKNIGRLGFAWDMLQGDVAVLILLPDVQIFDIKVFCAIVALCTKLFLILEIAGALSVRSIVGPVSCAKGKVDSRCRI